MTIDVTSVFAAYFARTRGPDPNDPDHRQVPDYGVAASLDGNVVNLELTFRRGSAYCCYEYGCHLNLPATKRWEWLRRELANQQIAVPPRLELRLVVVIEEGALFFDLFKPDPTRRCWYAFAPVEAHRYQASVLEAENPGDPEAEPDQPQIAKGGA
jgi:hypothetical protein